MPIANVNNIDIYYEQHGQGEPLLLISGYASDHLAWAGVLSFLAERYRVILIDNRDSGLSQQAQNNYSIVDMASDAAALLDHLKISKAHVVGHSMGGLIAQELALHHADKVNKLLLYATTAKFDARACFVLKQRRYFLGLFRRICG